MTDVQYVFVRVFACVR